MKTVCASLFAFVLGLALVLSCSDDSPDDADAAVCDCAAAEAPITSQRLARETSMTSIPVGTGGAPETTCVRGIAISGFCQLDFSALRNQIHLIEAGLNGSNGWRCQWFNNSAAATTGSATVVCLVPAE